MSMTGWKLWKGGAAGCHPCGWLRTAALLAQLVGQGGHEGRKFEIGTVDQIRHLHQAYQVDRAVDAVDILLFQVELGEQEFFHVRRAGVGNFQPYRIAKLALAQFALQGRAQVFQVFVFHRQLAVAGDAELVAALYRHAQEQLVHMRVQNGGQEDKGVRVAAAHFRRHLDHARQNARGLHDGNVGLAAKGIAAFQFHGKVERLVQHLGEGMGRVQPDRREDGHQLVAEEVVHPFLLLFGPFVTAQEDDVFFTQCRKQYITHHCILLAYQFVRGRRNARHDLGRRGAVCQNASWCQLGGFLQPGHAHFEELVQIGGDDAQVFQALEQRQAWVFGLGQYSAVEFDQAQFTVKQQLVAL
jgi:hypothetical protein